MKKLDQYKLIIFDLDGTLLNTIADLGEACNYALGKRGWPLHNLEAYRQMVGNGIRNLLGKASPAVSEEEITDLWKDFTDYYNSHCTDLTVPYKGIPELLQMLKERGIKLAVCSNKYQKAVDKIIDYFFPETFVSVYGEREGIPRKPSPAMIDCIIDEQGAEKESTLLIGDSEVDIATSRNAGIDCVGVTWGFRNESQLLNENPELLVSSPDELVTAIGSP